jgi:hypothetical protein
MGYTLKRQKKDDPFFKPFGLGFNALKPGDGIEEMRTAGV